MPDDPTPSRRERRRSRRRQHRLIAAAVTLLVLIAAATAVTVLHSQHSSATRQRALQPPATTTSSPPSTTTTTKPVGPGCVPGKVTAVGDSVMIDYQQPLEADLPGISVDGGVSRQWYEGEQILSALKAENQLGATVIIGLSTNGPISATDFDAMMAAVSCASKVVFVNVHVDQPWQDPNNAVLAAGVARNPNAILVDWNALATKHPEWFGADGTHLAINGTAAQQLAALISSSLS